MSKSSDTKDHEHTVLLYLEKFNRPYSVNDVAQNLHNSISKSMVQKALDQLVSTGQVREKVYNKQKIYSVIQSEDDSTDFAEKSKCLELTLMEKKERLTDLETEVRTLEKELASYQTCLTTSEARKRKVELQSIIVNLEERLQQLSSNKVAIKKSDKEKIEKEYELILKAYRKRKRICTDILDSILESYPKSKKALVDELGLEMDNDTNTPNVLRK